MNMRVITVTLILIAMMSASVPAVRGQSTSPDADKLQKLRDEIKARETADPPADLVDLNRTQLIERRAQLRTLLKAEIVKLQKHQSSLGTFITPAETQKANEMLESYNAELKRLGAAMQTELAADVS